MEKYIGFDIDTVKTAICVIQKGKKEKFYTLSSEVEAMIQFLKKQQQPGFFALCINHLGLRLGQPAGKINPGQHVLFNTHDIEQYTSIEISGSKIATFQGVFTNITSDR